MSELMYQMYYHAIQGRLHLIKLFDVPSMHTYYFPAALSILVGLPMELVASYPYKIDATLQLFSYFFNGGRSVGFGSDKHPSHSTAEALATRHRSEKP